MTEGFKVEYKMGQEMLTNYNSTTSGWHYLLVYNDEDGNEIHSRVVSDEEAHNWLLRYSIWQASGHISDSILSLYNAMVMR